MKIVQLTKIYWPDNGGGISTVAESIARGMMGEEQQLVICQRTPGLKKVNDSYGGVPVVRCKQLKDVASTPLSFEYLEETARHTKDADIVVCHHPYPMNDLAILFGKTKAKKTVFWWHCDIEQYGALAKVYAPLVRHSLKKADAIIVSSEGNIVNSKLLLPFKDKCHVIPFAVSDEYFEKGAVYCDKKWGAGWRDSLADENDAKSINLRVDNAENVDSSVNILFLGRMVWYKGCEYLLEAFAKMENKNVTLTMVGGGPLEDELKEKAKSLGISDRVEFTGMVSEEEKMERIKACDFLVLPSVSKAEAFALVQIESMAFGKPVINTNLPSGVPYVSLHEKTGLTVEPEDVDALKEAMDLLASDSDLRVKYGKAARQKVEKEHQNKIFVEKHKEVFENLLK